MKTKKPVIAIVCNQEIPDDPQEVKFNEVNHRYTTAILNAGGLPVLIPIEYPVSEIAGLREMFSGVFLIGGEDVAIKRFGGKPHPSVSMPNLERDDLEIELTRMAVKTNWPILGICRGVQAMNVALGGTLFSDIADQVPESIRHNCVKGTPRNAVAHTVLIDPSSQIGEIYGVQELPVNSFHHQAIKDTAKNFKPVGVTPEGLVEAVEIPENRFAIGVQWHPECIQDSPNQMKLFIAFVNACKTS